MCPNSAPKPVPRYSSPLITIPPPIPVPRVIRMKFLAFIPSLDSASAKHPASFFTSTFFLYFFSRCFFRLKFFRARFGASLTCPSFISPAIAMPIPFAFLGLSSSINSSILLMNNFLSFGVGICIRFRILFSLTMEARIVVPPISKAMIFFAMFTFVDLSGELFI